MHKFFFNKDDTRKQSIKTHDAFYKTFESEKDKKDICVTIEDIKKSPTNRQRAYLRGCICEMVLNAIKELGNDNLNNEDVYRLLKERGGFYKTIKLNIKGNITSRIIYESFSNKGNRKRLIEFIDFCIRWSAEWLNIVIPEPSERGFKIKGEKQC